MHPYAIPNTQYENGKKVLYLRIMKALYGCIELSLLWYDLYMNTLKELVFPSIHTTDVLQIKSSKGRNVRSSGMSKTARCPILT